jgi:two-component system OmpR family sensor kinase
MELGALRHTQGFDDHEILKEFEIFGRIVFGFVSDVVSSLPNTEQAVEIGPLYVRLLEAVSTIQEATATQFHELTRRRVAEREARLRLFNRGLTHELRNLIGAALGASETLQMPKLEGTERDRLTEIILRNLRAMESSIANLLELTRVTTEAIPHRNVRLPNAARESIRQMRDAARSAGVSIRLAADMADVEVHAAAVELCLTNLLSNAIKYADRTKPERWVEVAGRVAALRPPGTGAGASGNGAAKEVIVEVRDNGVGVPDAAQPYLFDRFFRASAERAPHVPGTGLGLSIVRDAVEGLGGRVWADFPSGGSVFAFALPLKTS